MKFAGLIFLAVSTLSYSQGKKIISFEVKDTIEAAAIDRPGDLYLLSRSGLIQRFDINGMLLSQSTGTTPATLFDPRDGSRLFAFYRDTRQYAYLSPSFDTPPSTYKIDSVFALDPWLVAASGDYNIWIVDAADWTLKKIDTKKESVVAEVSIHGDMENGKSNFTFLREYQGFVFLLDKTSGIRIYNSIGKYIRTITATNILYFNFLGEEIYYRSQNKLEFFNLFTAQTREIELKDFDALILLSDERYFHIQPKSVTVFEFKP